MAGGPKQREHGPHLARGPQIGRPWHRQSQQWDNYAVILCPYSETIHMIALSWKQWRVPSFTAEIFGCIVQHQMWLSSRTPDLSAQEDIRLPQHKLCGDDVFFWAAESCCCAINLLLRPRRFLCLRWRGARLAVVDLSQFYLLSISVVLDTWFVVVAQVLLYVTWRNKCVIWLNRSIRSLQTNLYYY